MYFRGICISDNNNVFAFFTFFFHNSMNLFHKWTCCIHTLKSLFLQNIMNLFWNSV